MSGRFTSITSFMYGDRDTKNEETIQALTACLGLASVCGNLTTTIMIVGLEGEPYNCSTWKASSEHYDERDPAERAFSKELVRTITSIVRPTLITKTRPNASHPDRITVEPIRIESAREILASRYVHGIGGLAEVLRALRRFARSREHVEYRQTFEGRRLERRAQLRIYKSLQRQDEANRTRYQLKRF